MPKLGRQIASGIGWNAIQLIVERSFSFIIKLILARLLFPEAFGIIGMAVVFTSFINVLNNLGIGAALVQRKKEHLNEIHFHTAFWAGLIWSVILYLIIAFVVAPLAASFYNEPILEKIIPVLGIGILLNTLNLVHKAQLTKSLNFKKITIISNISNISAGIISLVLAYMGAGVWSLVFNSVAISLIGIPLYFRATGWVPEFKWRKKEFKDVFGFGVYTTGTSVFNNLISKIDYLIIGKMLSASALGVYTLAFILTDTFRSQLMNVMNKVMYPVYGRVQDDKVALKNYYLKVVSYNSVIVYPIMIFMFICGAPFINQFFGEKWNGSIWPLKILSISVMFHLMVNSNTSLIRGLGKAALEMKLQIFKATLMYVPLIVAGTYYYGIMGAAIAILINKILSVFIAQYFLDRLVNIKFKDLIRSLRAPILASVISGTISYIIYEQFDIHYLFVAVFIGSIYSFIIYLFMKNEIIFFYQKLIKEKYAKKNK